MTRQMEMNYGELCAFFKEEKKRSGRTRQLQFKKDNKSEIPLALADGMNDK